MNEIQPNLLSFGVIELTLGVVISALKHTAAWPFCVRFLF